MAEQSKLLVTAIPTVQPFIAVLLASNDALHL